MLNEKKKERKSYYKKIKGKYHTISFILYE